MKQLYLAALITGVLGVLAGVCLVLLLASRGRTNGDGLYRTTSDERARIRQGDDPAKLRAAEVPDPDQPARHANADRDVKAKRRAVWALPRPEVETVSGHEKTTRISRPGETIDVSVSGSDHTVTIESGTRVKMLILSGTSHSVIFEPPASVGQVLAGGTDNVLVVPEGVEFEMIGTGAIRQIAEADAAID